MIEPRKCTVCNPGYLIPAGDNPDFFKCNNLERRMHSQNKAVDNNRFATVKFGDSVDMDHFRNVEGDYFSVCSTL
jgi:hypothetical protein